MASSASRAASGAATPHDAVTVRSACVPTHYLVRTNLVNLGTSSIGSVALRHTFTRCTALWPFQYLWSSEPSEAPIPSVYLSCASRTAGRIECFIVGLCVPVSRLNGVWILSQHSLCSVCTCQGTVHGPCDLVTHIRCPMCMRCLRRVLLLVHAYTPRIISCDVLIGSKIIWVWDLA